MIVASFGDAKRTMRGAALAAEIKDETLVKAAPAASDVKGGGNNGPSQHLARCSDYVRFGAKPEVPDAGSERRDRATHLLKSIRNP
jgi:hypothetical protein